MILFDRAGQMGPLRDPITAITGGAGILTNIIGGIKGRSAANQAAQIQADAAKAAGKKIEDTTAATNPAILEAASNASGALATSADRAAAGVASAADRANALQDPYRLAGENATVALDAGLAPGGDFNKNPTMADIQIDPGYAYRQKQAELALSRGAAARGTVQSGGFAVDLNKAIQGQASQEYQAAFDRFRQSTGDRFSRLNTVSGRGQDAASTEGTNLLNSGIYGGNITTDATKTGNLYNINATDTTSRNTIDAAKEAADLDTQAANATAAGKVAGTNALWGGITGGVNAGTSALQFNKITNLLKNPATSAVSSAPFPGYDAATYRPKGFRV